MVTLIEGEYYRRHHPKGLGFLVFFGNLHFWNKLLIKMGVYGHYKFGYC